jgi:cob(I)alamin adenosyltransferase
MSIVTKTGDQGLTSMMYNRRVSKCHPRVEAYGVVDELNAALGMANASTRHAFVREQLALIQKDLIVLMGELATDTQDLPRYVRDGFSLVSPDMTAKLETVVKSIEGQQIKFRGWATPGASLAAVTLDVARTVCRRAERRVCALQDSAQLHNSEIVIYLNRLSDLLWLLARWTENQTEVQQ